MFYYFFKSSVIFEALMRKEDRMLHTYGNENSHRKVNFIV
jgi:hypothetical protein